MIADSIEPANKETSMIGREGESVTLSCTYDTSSNYVYLYWYRQYPNYRQPLYLLRKGARSYSRYEHIPDHRFQSSTSKSSTELTIKSVTLSNSAHYYCAIRVHLSQSFRSATTVIQNAWEALQKLTHCYCFEQQQSNENQTTEIYVVNHRNYKWNDMVTPVNNDKL